MKTIKSILTLLLVCNFALIASSQMGMGKYEDIAKIEHRKLIIIIEEPKDFVIKKLTRKKKLDKVEDYKAALEIYNNNMKEVFAQFWPYKANGFEFKTYNEVIELKKTNKNFAVAYCFSQRPDVGYEETDYDRASGIDWSWDMSEEGEDKDYLNHFTSIVITTMERFGFTPVYSTQLPDIFPTKASLVFGVTGMSGYFEYRLKNKNVNEKVSARQFLEEQVAANAQKLVNKTLLIREDLLDKNLPKTAIGKYYPYAYTVCGKADIDSAILQQKENIAYVVILPTVVPTSNIKASIMYFLYVFDAKDNSIMAYIQPSTGAMMGAVYGAPFGANKAGETCISKDALLEIVKMSKKK